MNTTSAIQSVVTGKELETHFLDLVRARFVGHMVRLVKPESQVFVFAVAEVHRITVPATVLFELLSDEGDPYWVTDETQIFDLG